MKPVVPLYYQIKQTIKNAIINGEFRPKDKIPSENELAKEFNVSRLTVRQATSQLIQEGFLRSRRGEGTFVTDDHRLIDSFGLEFTGFMDDLFYQVGKTQTKSVVIREIDLQKHISEKVKFLPVSDQVIQIKRVRYRGEQSFAYTVNYLPLGLGRQISEKELYQKPLLQIMEQDLGIEFSEAFQTIEAAFADQEVAEKLGITSGLPILFVERIMYTKKQGPVELVQSSYRGDLYKYIVRLKHLRRKRKNVWVHQTE